MAYVFGYKDVNESLKEDKEPDTDKMNKSISKEIDKKTWRDRIQESQTIAEIERIFATEAHRVFCDGQWDSADGRATHKTWVTRQDEKVRDSHWYLDGLTVKIDDYFYTLNGDRAKHPGEFGVADEDINCRCRLKYSKRR